MARVLVGTIVLATLATAASASETRLHELQRRADALAREAKARQPVRRCGMPVAPIQSARDRMVMPVRPGALFMPMTTPNCDVERATRPRRSPASRPVGTPIDL